MSSQGPKGQSAAVYRRRRLAVGILAVLALLGLWWLVSTVIGWFSDDTEEPQEPTSQQQESADQDPDAGPSAGNGSAAQEEGSEGEDDDGGSESGSCAPGDIQVTADTGDETYAPDEAPLLIMEIEHTGDEGCTLDVGTAQQSFVVASGGREIFNTAQCGSGEGGSEEGGSEEGGVSLEMDFEPGQTERAQLTWPRSESAADCTEPAELEPGTYELTVSLGGITSEAHEFTLSEV